MEDDEDDEDSDVEMADEGKKYTPSSRRKKMLDEVSNADTESSESSSGSTAPSTAPSEEEEDTSATPVDDGLPHPRVSLHTCTKPHGYWDYNANMFHSPSKHEETSSSEPRTSGRRFS